MRIARRAGTVTRMVTLQQGAPTIDLHIPGCPPHAFTILDGVLGLFGHIDKRAAQARAEAVRR